LSVFICGFFILIRIFARSLLIPIQIMFATHQYILEGKAMPIGVNLSSNAYPTHVLPHPLIPSPPAGRGSFGFRQNWGGVTRIVMVGE
ncbi:hypothetical protein BV375_31860, partial [Nostoc sp. 106C]